MGAHSAIWQGYVDSSLMGSGQFDKAAILAADFSDTEASTPGFTITPQELAGLKASFADPGNAFANGLTVGGEKFVTIRADERSQYGKKGKEGIVVVNAKSCILVAHHGEAVATPNAAIVVEGVADYLTGASK